MLLARLAIALLVAGACMAPAVADPPSITSYFAGTWSCSTGLGSQSVKAYGLVNNGQALMLANPYVTPMLRLKRVRHVYRNSRTHRTPPPFRIAVTMFGKPAVRSVQIRTATSSGWAGDTLAFAGQVVNGTQITQQHETYQRIDPNHFTRTFEVAENLRMDGPWSRNRAPKRARGSYRQPRARFPFSATSISVRRPPATSPVDVRKQA